MPAFWASRTRPGDGRRFPAARRAHHGRVTRQHRLLLRGNADLHLLMANRQAQSQIAAAVQELLGLLIRQREDGASSCLPSLGVTKSAQRG
ncbi:MAG TPA: hypothetical protein VMG10_11020, partial [Gemmataceae bacterium]|nr:hypothetical protein [Gemmataceae bacterium]